jgi:ABC-2 type transport system ATP-binding protein
VSIAVAVKNLTKHYGAFPAVKGIDFEIHAGEVFGLLGPNGAGKTTTVEILEGLRPRTGGDVSVLGIDPARDSRRLKDRIGVCLQSTQLADKITVIEAVRLFASLYSRRVDGDVLLKRLQLWEKRNDAYARLSGGQKQRLALTLALVNDPQMLFSTSRPAGSTQARHEIHLLVQEWRAERHDPADHALHRGGRAAVRSRRDHRRRPDHCDGHADGVRGRSASAHRSRCRRPCPMVVSRR